MFFASIGRYWDKDNQRSKNIINELVWSIILENIMCEQNLWDYDNLALFSLNNTFYINVAIRLRYFYLIEYGRRK